MCGKVKAGSEEELRLSPSRPGDKATRQRPLWPENSSNTHGPGKLVLP